MLDKRSGNETKYGLYQGHLALVANLQLQCTWHYRFEVTQI